MAISNDGKLYGWGYGGDCRLGDPKITGTQKTPALIDFSASKCQFKITANIGETYSGKITNSSGTAFAVDTQPTKGVFAFTSAGDGSFTYTPNDDAKGTDFAEVSFSFNGTKYSYLVNIVLNHLPSFGTTSLSKTTPQKTAFSDGIFGVDADGDALSYSISSLPKKGDFTINNSTGEYTYTPFDTSAGDDSFGIAISDGKQYVYSRIYVHIESSIITIESGGNFSLNLASASTLVGNVGATDADGDPLSYSLSLAPLLGNVILGADGSYTYTALSSSCGTDSFAITVTDGVTPVVLRYKIVLYSIKDAGTVIDHSIPINSTFVGSLLTTFENTTPQYSIVTNPKKGTVNISSSTGEYTYTAGSGFAGSDSFTVTVDYGYGSYSKTINMYLDTAPDVSAVSTHITTNQGVTYSGTVQATDLDAGAVLSYSVSEEPKKGSVSLNEYTGSYSYVPLATAAGDDQFTADVSDGTNVVHVVIYVHIETAIVSDTTLNRVTSQNVSLSGSIVASDADGDTLSYSIDTQASHGVASVESTTGKYVYIPTTNYYGSDSFVVKITDGSNPVLVTINVKVNQKPTTSAPTQNFSTKGQSVSGNANCADPDGDALTYSVSTQPTMGSVILDSSTGVFAYTPNVDAAGNDTFKITATDGCDDIIVTVTVHNETDLIIATQETSITVNQGKNTSGQVSASDADGDTLKYSVSASPSKGTLALNENTGAWTYLANSDAKGTDSFTVSVTDGNVAKTITYSLKINAPAEFASTTKTSVTTNQGENYTDTVSATDADGDKLTYSVVQQGSKGEVTINPETGRYVYVPKTGAAGDDSFVLGVTDGNFTTELTIKMHIESPITVSTETQKAETSQGDIATGSISASDPDGDTLTYSISQQGTKGTASVSNDGKWSYFASNSAGNDTFVIAVSDGSHTVYVTVSVHINSKPGFDQSSSNVSVGHGQSVSGDASASDADGDALTFTVSTQPQYGTVDLNSTNGHFTYTSLSSSTSSKDSFVVAVTDGNTTAYMTVNVTINNAPTAQNVSIEVAQGGSKSGQVSATDSDNDVLSYSIGSQGAKGTATINTKTGAFEYVANHDSTGEDVFTVEISDGLNKTVISVKVTIHANQAPAVDNTTANVTNGQSTSGKINATDPNGNPLDFTISQQGTKGVASINATTGEYVYKANLNASGTDTFSVAISNGYNVSNVTVTVSINTTAMTAVLGAVGIIAYTGVVIAAVKLISKGSKKHLEGGAGK
jgi:VCBS repeat-containing protein